MKILYSSGELHDAIKNVLADPEPNDRRVVLVAFVGGQAEAFLPDPKGLEIVCWLQPGSTDALTLGRLRDRGALIYKSERLHMKVYWSSSRGCVICSANASGSALGGGHQKEAGVWLPPGQVDIDRLWANAKPQPIKGSELKGLPPPPVNGPNGGNSPPPPDFIEWLNSFGRPDWKIGWWTSDGAYAKEAVEVAKKSYGVPEPNNMLNVKKGQLHKRDWVLQFGLPSGTYIKWMKVDFVIEVPRSDKAAYEKDYPFQAVQVNLPSTYRPPFGLDKSFRSAFKKAIQDYGEDQIESMEKSLRPPKSLLDLIAQNMTVT